MKLFISVSLTLISSLCLGQTFGVLGDGGVWNQNTYKIRKAMMDGGIRDLVMPGDNLYDLTQTYDDAWGPWRSKGFKFPIVAVGNHYKTIEQELAYFGFAKTYYSKKVKGVHFIVMDSEQDHLAHEQSVWLVDQLEKVKPSDILLVVFHHPPVTISKRHHWHEKAVFHHAILPILLENKEKIDLVLVGHDHIAGMFKVNDLPFVVSGASMEIIPTKPVSYFDDERNLKVETRWHFNNKDPYWTRLDMGENEIWVNFVNAKRNSVDCSVRLHDKYTEMKANCFSKND